MYEKKYGTDWEELSMQGALERAYALGVMEGIGEPLPEEYERILETAQSAYERHLVEMAHEEGIAKARSIDRTGDEEESWSEAMDVELEGIERMPDRERMPSRGSPDMLDAPASDDRPSNLDLPEFLFR